MMWKKYSKIQISIILLLLVSLSIQAFIGIKQNSVTWDESCFIAHGKAIFDTGYMRYMLLMDHGPLSYYVNSIFLLPLKFDRSIWVPPENPAIECQDIGQKALFESGYDFKKILFVSRLPFVFLSLILAFYVLSWSTQLYGEKSGIIALLLYSFNPTIIAYSGLIVSDFVVAMMIFIATYYFWKLIKEPSKKNLILTGIFFGLAQLSKTTAILLILFYVIIGFTAVYKKENNIRTKTLIRYFLVIFLITFLLIFVFYKFQFGTFNDTLPPTHYGDKARAELGKIPYFSEPLLFIYDKVPFPAPLFIGTIGTVFYLSLQQSYGYVFGNITEGIVWYFPIVSFLLKTSLPLLIMILLLLVFHKKLPKKDIVTYLSLIAPILLFFIIFSNTDKMAGIRHIFTIYPFVFVLVSNIINIKIKRKKYFHWIIGALLFFYVLSTISIAPFYLSYINILGLGPNNGWKISGGTDIDLGQDLMGLKQFMERNNIDKINLSYFGSVDPKHYGISYDYMPSPYFQPWDPDYSYYLESRYENCSERKGKIAISVTNLLNIHLFDKTCYDWLKSYEPIEKIGYSIFIYDIE
ncbi:hypothetical protein CMO94_01330 [Candidatus Woesearchaeota archaeon]|jgi:hypothetical protein|nr:hypothetical protein [Candidatus Woesearchaeota archaeon]MDP7244013.1 glycosyltransferase family 39 protein [Flavobacteriales bacterium]